MGGGAERALWLFAAAAIAFADQCAKLLAAHFLPGREKIIAPFLRFTYVENDGAAFSFLAGAGAWAQWVLRGISAVACVILIWWLLRRPPRWDSAAAALLLGGAFGNLIDRFRLGYVVDFIDAHVGAYHWPAFNIADSAITAGACILLWRAVFVKSAA